MTRAGEQRRQAAEQRSPQRRWWWSVAVIAALAVVVGACGSDDDDEAGGEASETTAFDASDESDDTGFDAAAETDIEEGGDTEAGGDAAAADDDFAAPNTTIEAGDGETVTESAGDESSEGATDVDGTADPLGAGGTRVTPTAADLGRQLIFTAFVTVGVDDVSAASAAATAIIEDLGGFLFGQNTEGGPNARSELTFKVLPDDFNLALERLGSVGELRNQSVTTDDVTERVVDLRSRIEVAELGVARLRTALEGTEALEDYAEVERLLLDRESELEVMRGQLRTLEDRIDLATITLVLTQERVENAIVVAVTTYEGHDDGRLCPGRSGRSVSEGTDLTVCFEVTNAGDQTLTDIVLTDTVLGIEPDDELLAVFGDLTALAPGQSSIVAYETKAERTVRRLRTRVAAIPTDGVGGEPAGPAVQGDGQAEIDTFPSEGGPGFGDGFGAGVGVLRVLWTAVVLVVSFLIPLVVLVPLAWLVWRALGRRRGRKPSLPRWFGAPDPDGG